MDSPTPAAPYFKPMTLALAGLAVLAAASAMLPQSVRPWNMAALGARALFATARLRFPVALLLIAAAVAVKEVGVYLQYGFAPHPPTWFCLTGYAVLGWALLRKSESPLRIGATAVGASLLFFLTTNFLSWIEQAAPYGYSLAGLVNCYAAGIPFYRGTFLGDTAFTAALFGAHAVLSHAYFPAERVAIEGEQPTETW